MLVGDPHPRHVDGQVRAGVQLDARELFGLVLLYLALGHPLIDLFCLRVEDCLNGLDAVLLSSCHHLLIGH